MSERTPNPNRPARLGPANKVWDELLPSILQEWSFHQNPANPRFPREIIDRIFTFFIQDQPCLQHFEATVVPRCTRGCAGHCWCHLYDVNVIELQQIQFDAECLPRSIFEDPQKGPRGNWYGGFSPYHIIRQVDSGAAVVAKIAVQTRRLVVPLKSIKKRTFDDLESDDDILTNKRYPIGEFPTFVKENDIVLLNLPSRQRSLHDPDPALWLRRHDLQFVVSPEIRKLRRVAMCFDTFDSIRDYQVRDLLRNMDRFHLWSLCYDQKTSELRDFQKGEANPLMPPAGFAFPRATAWRPSGGKSGLHLLHQVTDWHDAVDPSKAADFDNWVNDNRRCFDVERCEYDRARISAHLRGEPRPDRASFGDQGAADTMRAIQDDRMELYREQTWRESQAYDELQPEAVPYSWPGGPWFLHDVLSSCDEFFLVIDGAWLEDDDDAAEYLETFDPGNVKDADADGSDASRICADCQYAHPNKPLRFGGLRKTEFVEMRACRQDLWKPLEKSLRRIRGDIATAWQKGAVTWDTKQPTRPMPKLRFLGLKSRKPLWTIKPEKDQENPKATIKYYY